MSISILEGSDESSAKCTRTPPYRKIAKRSAAIAKFVFVNSLASFCFAVPMIAALLKLEIIHANNSLMIAVITTVITIVISVCLSMWSEHKGRDKGDATLYNSQDGIQPLDGTDAELSVAGDVTVLQPLHVVKLGELAAIDERHVGHLSCVVGWADVGLVFAHGNAQPRIQVDFTFQLNDPFRHPEQRVDVVAGFLFGILVFGHGNTG
jgi:hypothetical protein